MRNLLGSHRSWTLVGVTLVARYPNYERDYCTWFLKITVATVQAQEGRDRGKHGARRERVGWRNLCTPPTDDSVRARTEPNCKHTLFQSLSDSHRFNSICFVLWLPISFTHHWQFELEVRYINQAVLLFPRDAQADSCVLRERFSPPLLISFRTRWFAKFLSGLVELQNNAQREDREVRQRWFSFMLVAIARV